MDKIDVSAPDGERKERFFARACGTKFAALVDGGNTTIDLYDEIGYFGTDARSFRSKLKDASGDITLRINSPGGDVFDGISIHNDLLSYDGKVRVEITGIAASIASIIAMAGDEIVMAPNSFMMIHDAWTIGVGNRHDFGTLSATLSKIDDALARTYAARSTTGIRAIKDMMDKETWLTASEAVEAGFATSVSSGASPQDGAKAKFDLSVFGHVPKALVWDEEAASEETPTKRDLERALTQDAGWSRSKARAALRVVEQRPDEPTQDAGEQIDFSALAEAVRAVSAALKT